MLTGCYYLMPGIPDIFSRNHTVFPEGSGSVTGAGEYANGAEVTITATINYRMKSGCFPKSQEITHNLWESSGSRFGNIFSSRFHKHQVRR